MPNGEVEVVISMLPLFNPPYTNAIALTTAPALPHAAENPVAFATETPVGAIRANTGKGIVARTEFVAVANTDEIG